MPPDTKTKVLSIQTLIYPHIKPSQLRSPTLKSRQFRPPTQQLSQFRCQHWNHVIFGACYFACYTYQYMFLWYSSITRTYNIIVYLLVLFLTFPYYSKTPKTLRKYTNTVFYFDTWYTHQYVWCWWPDFDTFYSSCTQYFFVSYIGRRS